MPSQLTPAAANNASALRTVARVVVKLALTVGAFYLLLAHHVTDVHGNRVTTFAVIRDFLPQIDIATFWRFVLFATVTKFIGILASMWRWSLLLEGQGIELPFRHIVGSFLIGRFLGTFLPSTIGLDGYKLYDAARFSGRSVEASGATLVEKVLGFAGIFITYLVALPFGISIFGEHAARMTALTLPVAVLPLVGCLALFIWPGPRLIDWAMQRIPVGPYGGFLSRLGAAVSAYQGKARIVLAATGLSFVVHFTTAAMYFFTALAIGVTAAQASFWQVTFASIIQILATVLSPFTIAGEGIREAAQYYLLSHLMGPAEAIVSAALGFWAAEGLTLFGGFIWWARNNEYTPAFCRVDGRQVDYAAAAHAARDFGFAPRGIDADSGAATDSLGSRLIGGLLLGAGGGILAGVILGVGEAAVTLALAGKGEDVQVLWYAVLLYGVIVGAVGAGMGAAFSVLPLAPSLLDRWTPVVAFVGAFLPVGLAVSLFRLQRDVYAEQRPPLGILLVTVAAGMLLTLVIAWLIARVLRPDDGDYGSSWVRRLRRFAVAVTAWLLVVAAGALGAAARSPAVPATRELRTEIPPSLRDRPNVILVIVDTLRADHLGLYGDTRGLSPHIDALGPESSVFHTVGQSSWTKPSIATILTSLYASSHHAMSKTSILPDVATVAGVVHDAGYTTAGFVSNINLAPSFNFQQGFGEYTYLAPDYLFSAEESSSKLVLYNIVRKIWFTVNKSRTVTQYYQDSRTVNAHVLPWLARHKDDRFFLLVHYMDPHDPYFHHPYDGEAIARVENPDPSPELGPRMRELYAGEIAYMDESFGAVVEQLRRDGIYDHTAVVLVADHGEEFQDHGGWWHGTTLYDEAIEVPLVVKWPSSMRGAAAPGHPIGHARLLDVAPTIVSIAGVSPPSTWQGEDLRRGIPSDRSLFAEEDFEGNVLSAVQTGEMKLIHANPGNPRGLAPTEMYDLQGDPRETKNLATNQPENLTRLEAALAEAHSRAAQQAVAGGNVEMDATTRERLRALGYVQ